MKQPDNIQAALYPDWLPPSCRIHVLRAGERLQHQSGPQGKVTAVVRSPIPGAEPVIKVELEDEPAIPG